MVEKINIIKAKFEMIKTILGDTLTLEDLSHPKYLKILIDASENTYLQLNDGMCDNLSMCKECASKRDTLNNYIQLLDDIELGNYVNEDIEQKLSQYPKIIQDVIDRIDTVLLEMQAS